MNGRMQCVFVGDPGVIGSTGSTGNPGTRGQIGNTGPSGVVGWTGQPGPSGTRGGPGWTGPTGERLVIATSLQVQQNAAKLLYRIYSVKSQLKC